MERLTSIWRHRPRASFRLWLLLMLSLCHGLPAQAVAGELVNRAVASGLGGGALIQSDTARAVVGIEPARPGLRVSVDVAISGDAAPGLPRGDRLDYAIVVENVGDIALAGVRLALELQQGGQAFAPSEPPGYRGGDLTNPGILDRGEIWRYSASYRLTRANAEIGGEIAAEANATAKGAGRSVSDRQVTAFVMPPLQGIAPGLISLSHTPSTTEAAVGDQVDYTITVSNRSSNELSATLVATLSEGTVLVDGSAFRDGELADVLLDGQQASFGTLTVAPHESMSLRYLGEIEETPLRGYHSNSAKIFDARSRIALAPPSEATVRVGDEPLGDCAAISLLVYEDANRNGVADTEEGGIAGARVSVDGGPVLTTDLQGLYSSPCVSLPRLSGVQLRFALDEATLGEGYHATTSNPMTLGIEPGGQASVTFGVAQSRVVRLDLNAAAFRRNEVTPDVGLAEGITRLISELTREHSILRLTYHAHREAIDLPEARLETVRNAILERWAAAGASYDLEIEARVAGSGE
ncbi:hypothetical protein [Oricola sp.]|uniref:DUF11 domain-containing protein n=1 Tax=Oricola sp. TaxID=1979950 RepID=UPI0025EA4C27|nr:hypothetical protein [Oricola sp.]MCI5076295.1 hypothetical protein [Oricola sp.]